MSRKKPEIVSDKSLPTPAILPGADAYSDVSYFYTNVLWGYPEPDLDSVKQIAKRFQIGRNFYVNEDEINMIIERKRKNNKKNVSIRSKSVLGSAQKSIDT